MQSLATLAVCTIYAGITHFILFNNSVRTANQWITTADTSACRQYHHRH